MELLFCSSIFRLTVSYHINIGTKALLDDTTPNLSFPSIRSLHLVSHEVDSSELDSEEWLCIYINQMLKYVL